MAPRLFLIDGYALIYRAFFAMISRPLRTTKGENTSAAWGVVNFLMRLREKHRPDYLAWVNDAGTSFREERYPDYKSTREKLDDELQADFDRSLERISALLEAFRIPIISVPGYEADDVIATLATRAAERDLQAVIVSGDKDFYQLIGPRICLLNPGRGGPAAVDETWVDESNAGERLGVPPHQVVDFLALVGDSSDNVPGVKGIGEKGAQKLLAEYGNLENLLAHAGEVTAKRSREALLEQADNARLSQELVTIKRDVPVEIDVETLRAGDADTERLVKLATELEFTSIARKFLDDGVRAPAQATLLDGDANGGGGTAVLAAPAPLPVRAEPCATVVTSVADLPGIIARLRAAPLVALDLEASSLEPHSAQIIGLSLAASPTEVWYLPFGHRVGGGELAGGGAAVENLPPMSDPALAGVRELLTDPTVPKAGHNIKYDWQVLRRAGIELAGVAYDSMLASFVLEPGRRTHAMEALALEHFGRSMRTYADLVGKGKNEIPFAEVAVSAAADFCGDDTATVLALHELFDEQLRLTGMDKLLHEVEMPLVPVLVDMEWAGITIDRTLLSKISAGLGADLARLEEEIAREAGEDLNLNSPRQLATVLFEKLKLPVTKKTKSGPSTDAEVLEGLALQHRLPQLILDYRELQKLKSTYVDSLPLEVSAHTHRIHTSFNQTGAATGRLASSDPNLQNIPIRTTRGAEIRASFVPGEGCTFVVADYSQIELRLMAHLSGDPAFIEAFQKGGDIHRQTAAVMFKVPVEDVTSEMRAAAKTINFATIYGQGAFALSRKINVSLEDARTFIKEYFERFSGVREYLDRQVRFAREQGYVETISGRRRYIPEIRDRNFNMRAYGERTAQNSPLQGSAADLIKIAMIRIHGALVAGGMASRMLLQVHDELVFEAPEDEIETLRHIVRRHMEGAAELRVPLVVDVGTGPNWRDAKH